MLRLQHGANIGRRHAYHFAFAGFSRLFTFYLTWQLTALWRPAMIPTRLSSHHLDSQRHSVRRLPKRPQLSTDNKASDGCETFAKSTARLLSAPASLIWFLGTRRKDNEDAAPLCRTQAPHIHPVGSAPDNMAHIGTFNYCRAQSSLSNAPLANRLPARNFFIRSYVVPPATRRTSISWAFRRFSHQQCVALISSTCSSTRAMTPLRNLISSVSGSTASLLHRELCPSSRGAN